MAFTLNFNNLYAIFWAKNLCRNFWHGNGFEGRWTVVQKYATLKEKHKKIYMKIIKLDLAELQLRLLIAQVINLFQVLWYRDRIRLNTYVLCWYELCFRLTKYFHIDFNHIAFVTTSHLDWIQLDSSFINRCLQNLSKIIHPHVPQFKSDSECESV